jgi:hypothetical protein
MLHEEVILNIDSTFYYKSNGCLMEEDGAGRYLISNDTISLIFPDIPDSIKGLVNISHR